MKLFQKREVDTLCSQNFSVVIITCSRIQEKQEESFTCEYDCLIFDIHSTKRIRAAKGACNSYVHPDDKQFYQTFKIIS